MRVLAWSRSIVTRARNAVALLAAPPAPPQLVPQTGPALARQRLGDAAAALLEKGASQPEAFRLLRLELNRLEQGGLATLQQEAPRQVEPTPPPNALATWARGLAARVLRAA